MKRKMIKKIISKRKGECVLDASGSGAEAGVYN